VLVALCLSSFASAQVDEKKKKKQAKVLAMKDKALADLIKSKPEVASEINNSPGYAVFDNNGIHLLLLATSKGNGVVVSNNGGAASAIGATVGGTKIYTITKKGVALQATLGGTKFSSDGDLN
jgi:hypothetical protein